jgi:hypothetical protein
MTVRASLIAVASVAAVAVAGCGGGNSSSGTTGGGGSTTSAPAETQTQKNVSGSISFEGVWTGPEAKAFQAVIDGFNQQYPDVDVKYKPEGDQLPTVLSTAVAGGNPPDMASVPQPGLVQQFVAKGALKPITFAKQAIQENFAPNWADLGTFGGDVYGLVFKASNKSTVWNSTTAFKNAGVTAPKTWDDFLNAAKTLKASGVPAYSLGAADGWTLTDLFENIYLRQAGPDMYDKLTAHKIPWTDASVKKALQTMAQVVGDTSNIVGGTSGALQTDFPTSVNQVFRNPPKGAMVIEGDFVPGVATVKATAGKDYQEFPFPSIDGSEGDIVGGGDTVVQFRDTPATEAFITYLTTPEAATIWAKRGGYATGNTKVDPSVFPSDIDRSTGTALQQAKNFRFDMSDQQPAAFGATLGQGEWKIFQDFVKNPKDIDGTASALEQSAAKAYKKS